LAQFYSLGAVDFEDCLSLQRRLEYDALTRADGRITVLLCEHQPLLSVGRGAAIPAAMQALADERQLEIRPVDRGGGCVLHEPGRLAVYAVVPLAWHGWSVGQYLGRWHLALAGAGGEAQILTTIGIAVRQGITTQGAFVALRAAGVLCEAARSVKMNALRQALIQHLAAAFECPRYHLQTSHPLLAELSASEYPRELAA
jgi:lipoyl(octanoyl) transferase